VFRELFSQPVSHRDSPHFTSAPSWAPVRPASAETRVAIYLTRQVAWINLERWQWTDQVLLLQDEHSRLLFDDPHGNHYGSFGEQSAGIVQADPQEVQRETEALQKVVNHTSK
jgi:hypothetical protein